jgi:hypothetical protein
VQQHDTAGDGDVAVALWSGRGVGHDGRRQGGKNEQRV